MAMLVIAGCLLVAAADAVRASEPADAMRTIILQQMDAFKRDDGAGAFAYASPEIRAMFGTPEHFMQMVRRGYPQVYRPREVTFRERVVFQGKPALVVHIVGQDGSAVLALYPMQRQPDGSWRIDGCYLLKTSDVGA